MYKDKSYLGEVTKPSKMVNNEGKTAVTTAEHYHSAM
jgi:hypothetical protein